MEKSLLDYAYDYVSGQKGSVSFKDMWNYVCENAGLSEEEAMKKVSFFYTNLMLDGRFVTLGENQWDLRNRHTFDKVHIDMRDVYSDVESGDEDSEEQDEEEKEYEEVFEEKNDEKDEDSDQSSDEDSEL